MTSRRKRAQNGIGNALNKLSSDVSAVQTAAPVLQAGSVSSAALGTNSVGADALQPDSVDSNALGRGAVGTENLGVVNQITSDGTLTISAPTSVMLSGDGYPLPVRNSALVLTTSGNIAVGGSALPIGAIVEYLGTSAPSGWLFLDGSLVSRTLYPDLFSLYGTTYGAGDGSTTFGLPNAGGKALVGRLLGDPDFETMGYSGGSKTHAHTLSDAGQAQVALSSSSSNPIVMRRINTTNWTGNLIQGSAGATSASVSVGSAAALQGLTDSGNSMQPYLVAYYMVKAY